MFHLKSVGVLSVAKVMGCMYAIIGLIAMPFILLISLLGAMAGNKENPLGAMGATVVAIMMPFIYGALGFVGGAIMAALYNLMARFIGGIQLELHAAAPTVITPAAPIAPAP
jgi:hypothetical protein